MTRVLAVAVVVSLACGFGSAVEQGPVVTVITPVPGMSSPDVDSLVVGPMHAALTSVADVVRVDSVSSDGQAELSVTFTPGTHMYAVRADVADALTTAPLPDSAAIPMLMPWWDERIEVTVDPTRAESLKHALIQLPGINDVRLRGIPERRALAEVDPSRMVANGLSVTDLLIGRRLEDVAVVTVSEHSDVDVNRRGVPVAMAEILVTEAVFRPTLDEELARFEVERIGGSNRIDIACPDRPTCTALAADMAAALGATVTEASDRSARVWTDDLEAARTLVASRPDVVATLRTAHSARVVLTSPSDTPLSESDIAQLRDSLRALAGVVSLSPRHVGEPDVDVEVDPERAAMLGISTQSVTQTLQLQAGLPISLNGETLQLRWAQTPVQDLPLALPTGGTVRLADVSTITLTPRSAPIYRRDGRRAHAVEVYLQDEDMRLDLSAVVLPQGWAASVD